MQGHIHKRVRTSADGREHVTWYVVVDRGRDANGRRKQKWHGGFRTRREAEAARAHLVTDITKGIYLEPSKRTLEDFARSEWLPGQKHRIKPTTYGSYESLLELHVLPTLGYLPLRDLTGSHLNTLYAQLLESGRCDGKGGLSAKTVSYVHRLLHKLFADAVMLQLIHQNPAKRAMAPRPNIRIDDAKHSWSPEDVRQFLESVRSDRLYALWHLAAMTGMRRGELIGLRWQDIDFDSARLVVRQAIVESKYAVHVSTPKTHRSRPIDLDARTIDELATHRAQKAGEQEAWGKGYVESDYLFTKENGEVLHPQTVSALFEQHVTKSGVRRIRFHDLRHTHATIGLASGVPIKVISERLGHASPAFTLSQYAHVMPGMQAEAAAIVARAVEGAR